MVRLPRRVPLSRLKGARSPDQRSADGPACLIRHVGKQSKGELFSYAGHSAQQVILLPPHRTTAKGLPQPPVQVVPLLFQPPESFVAPTTGAVAAPSGPVVIFLLPAGKRLTRAEGAAIPVIPDRAQVVPGNPSPSPTATTAAFLGVPVCAFGKPSRGYRGSCRRAVRTRKGGS